MQMFHLPNAIQGSFENHTSLFMNLAKRKRAVGRKGQIETPIF